MLYCSPIFSHSNSGPRPGPDPVSAHGPSPDPGADPGFGPDPAGPGPDPGSDTVVCPLYSEVLNILDF